MRSVFLKYFLLGVLLYVFMLNTGHSQLVDRKPGKVFEIEGLITCRNFKNTHRDMVGVNVSVRSKSSKIEIQGVYMNNMAVTKEGTDQYRKVFNFPNMITGRSITIKIAYKDKHTNPPIIKVYTIARVKLDYFITYIFPRADSTIILKPGSLPSLNLGKTIFKWSSTRTPHGASVTVLDTSDGSKYRGESNINAIAIPSGFLKHNRKYKLLTNEYLDFIKLQPMATSSSYLQFQYNHSQYFYTR